MLSRLSHPQDSSGNKDVYRAIPAFKEQSVDLVTVVTTRWVCTWVKMSHQVVQSQLFPHSHTPLVKHRLNLKH